MLVSTLQVAIEIQLTWKACMNLLSEMINLMIKQERNCF